MAMYISTLLVASATIVAAYVPFPPELQRRYAGCSGPQQIEVCMAPLESLHHPTTGMKLEAVDSSEALDLVCRKVDTAENCIRDWVNDCSSQNLQMDVLVDTIEGVAGYLCGEEGRDALLTETKCWENKGLEQGLQACADSMETDAMMGVEPCSFIDNLRSCSTSLTERLCTRKAAKFVDSLLYYSIEPSANRMLGCQVRQRLTRDLFKLFLRNGN